MLFKILSLIKTYLLLRLSQQSLQTENVLEIMHHNLVLHFEIWPTPLIMRCFIICGSFINTLHLSKVLTGPQYRQLYYLDILKQTNSWQQIGLILSQFELVSCYRLCKFESDYDICLPYSTYFSVFINRTSIK